MVRVIAENGKFRVEGTFELGYMGVYKDGQIKLKSNCEEVRDWECIRFFPDAETCSSEKLAEYLTGYVNGLEKKLRHNIKKLNDGLLWNMFFDMEGGGIEFWECPELTVPELMPEAPDWENVYSPASDKMQEYMNKDKADRDPDIEAFLREILPMFNWDNLIKSIVPEYLHIKDTYLSFQCSDGFGGIVLCGAYNEFKVNSEWSDWHNF